MTNFLTQAQQSSQRSLQHSRIEEGIVLSTSQTNSRLSEHSVKVATASSGQIEAEVLVNSGGDYFLPPVESIVTVAHFSDETPVIIGSEYDEVDIQRLDGGERRIGHPTTDSHILFSNDGSITIQSDDGTTVTIENGEMNIEE